MNLMLMVTGLGIGGAERVVVDLADVFASKGHRVCLVYLGGDVETRPANSSVQLVGMNMRSLRDLPSVLLCKLPRLVREFRPDVLHTHMFHANVIGRLLRIRVSIPRLITTAHNTNEGGRLRMLIYRLTHSLSNVVTNVSDDAVRAFERAKAVPIGGMLAVHNGIAVNRYCRQPDEGARVRQELGVSDSTKMILSIGSLTRQKDHVNLIEAICLIREQVADFVVCIAGNGPLREQLTGLIGEKELGKHVRLLGIRSDVVGLLSAADVFVLSSAWEGFPMVIGEAMACSCVVVGTDCGGVREFLGGGAYLVKPGSAVALASGLMEALSLEPSEQLAVGASLRSRVVECFSLDAAAREWEGLYQIDPKS